MPDLTVNTVTRASDGLLQSLTAADAGGDAFVNDGKTFLIITNGDASSMTLTIVSQATVDGLAVADLTADVDAGETRLIGPFPPNIYNDNDSKVQLTYSSVTSLTLEAFKVGT